MILADLQQSLEVSQIPPISVRRDTIDYVSLLFAGALVIVGIIGICYAIKTLRAIQRQAGIMDGQLKAMQQQLLEMSKQTEVLEKSVAAAQSRADAANANIELVVNEERTRIFVEVDELDLAETVEFTHRVKYRVIFHSPTVAFVDQERLRPFALRLAAGRIPRALQG